MRKDALKEVLYGGVMELMRNRNFYYHSRVGAEYSHWTEDGYKALAEYVDTIGYMMLQTEEKELDTRAKDIVLRGLKGESK